MFALASAILRVAGGFAVSRALPYLDKLIKAGLVFVGGYGLVGQIPHQNNSIKTGSLNSSVPVSNNVESSDNSQNQPLSNLDEDLINDLNISLNEVSQVINNRLSADEVLNDVSPLSIDEVSSTAVEKDTLIDVLKHSSADNLQAINKLIKSIYDLQQVITASTVAITKVLDDGFTALSVSNAANSLNPVFNASNIIDTSPIATTLKPAIDTIATNLEAQKRYYEKSLEQTNIYDLDGNLVATGDSVDIDKIHKATISRAMTDLNNFSSEDMEDDIDFNDLLQNIDLSQLFKLIRLSSQLQNNGSINNEP